MPNNIQNEIRFDCTKKQFKEIAEYLRVDGSYLGTVDFNKLIPMPKELDIVSGSLGTTGIEMYKTYLDEASTIENESKKRDLYWEYTKKVPRGEEAMELGKKYYDNIKNYGAPTWYEWCIDHWGTKWNAYECEKASDNTLRFQTAWDGVPIIARELSKRFPDIKMEYRWADEDYGRNVGSLQFRAGNTTDVDVPKTGSREAYEMCAEIWRIDLEEEGFKLSEDGKTYNYESKYPDWEEIDLTEDLERMGFVLGHKEIDD